MENNRRFVGKFDNLRTDERKQRLQVRKVIDYTLAGLNAVSLLDVGTGSGIFAEGFHEKGLSVEGVDVRAEFVDLVSKLLPQAKFKVAPAEALPFKDNSFDVVFMSYVLHEADDFQQAVDEAYRVCTKRFAVLEAKPDKDVGGPPMEERLKPEFMVNLGKNAGFKDIDLIHLRSSTLVIYEK